MTSLLNDSVVEEHVEELVEELALVVSGHTDIQTIDSDDNSTEAKQMRVLTPTKEHCYLIHPTNVLCYRPDRIKKLMLCEQFAKNDDCPHGSSCNFVHATRATLQASPCNKVHVNYAYKKLAMLQYPTHDHTCVIRVKAPGPAPDCADFTGEQIMRTAGSEQLLSAHRLNIDDPPTGFLCAHFYANRVCLLGASCGFIHIAFIDPDCQPGQKAKKKQMPLPVAKLDYYRAVREATVSQPRQHSQPKIPFRPPTIVDQYAGQFSNPIPIRPTPVLPMPMFRGSPSGGFEPGSGMAPVQLHPMPQHQMGQILMPQFMFQSPPGMMPQHTMMPMGTPQFITTMDPSMFHQVMIAPGANTPLMVAPMGAAQPAPSVQFPMVWK